MRAIAAYNTIDLLDAKSASVCRCGRVENAVQLERNIRKSQNWWSFVAKGRDCFGRWQLS